MSIKLKLPSAESLIRYSLLGVEGVPDFSEKTRYDRNRMSGHSKQRRIMVPNQAMRHLQTNLREYLRHLPVDYTSATAYRPGCSVRENVGRHRDNRYFYLIDLENAFHHVRAEELATILVLLILQMAENARATLGKAGSSIPRPPPLAFQEKQLLPFLKRYCWFEGDIGLPQGGPASQDLFNIYCVKMFDGEIREYCGKCGIMYSRYGDDLTFSSRRKIGKAIRRRIRQMIEAKGFKLSHHKCEVVDIARVGGRSILINGIRLSWGGHMQVPASFVRSTRSVARAALMSGDETLFHRAQGLAACVFEIARGRELSRTEKKLALEMVELKIRRH